MDGFSALLRGDEDALTLDVAALRLCSIEYPNLELTPFLQILDSHAVELSERLHDRMDGEAFIQTANEYLFEELGFHGNERDYYNPRNSYLSDVLTSRTGIPITLAVVYTEIARRLAKPVTGIGLPGHFVVRYDDGGYSAYIDVFHGGRRLSEDECRQMAGRLTGIDFTGDDAILAPASKRQTVLRMLNNLRAIYFRARDYDKLRAVLNLLIEALPDSAEERKLRGAVHLQMQAYKLALLDFEGYLKLAPAAPDAAEVREQMRLIRKLLARLQ